MESSKSRSMCPVVHRFERTRILSVGLVPRNDRSLDDHRIVSFASLHRNELDACRRTKTGEQGSSYSDLSDGCGESNLGSDTHSRGAAQTGFQSIGNHGLTMASANPA